MRTTVTLDDDLCREIKLQAARSGSSFSSVIEEAVRRFLFADGPSYTPGTVTLPTMRSGGARPGIDLDDMSSVYEVLDEGRRPDAVR